MERSNKFKVQIRTIKPSVLLRSRRISAAYIKGVWFGLDEKGRHELLCRMMSALYVKFGQVRIRIASLINGLYFGRSPAQLHFGIDAAGHTFMEELMKSLSEIASLYDEWANANEVSVEEILVELDSF